MSSESKARLCSYWFPPFPLAAHSFLKVSSPFPQRCWAGLCRGRGRGTGKGRGALGARQDSDSAQPGGTFLQKQLKGEGRSNTCYFL